MIKHDYLTNRKFEQKIQIHFPTEELYIVKVKLHFPQSISWGGGRMLARKNKAHLGPRASGRSSPGNLSTNCCKGAKKNLLICLDLKLMKSSIVDLKLHKTQQAKLPFWVSFLDLCLLEFPQPFRSRHLSFTQKWKLAFSKLYVLAWKFKYNVHSRQKCPF